ncbi:MAG TPA: polyphosphate kinase [Alphaproteobacteria bacterium]|nr:polyphosphate kinase [Alphaproteobacteria bacterium]
MAGRAKKAASGRGKGKAIRLADIDLGRRLKDKATYEERLDALQLRLLQIQQAYKRQGRRGIVVLEGWGTAGKGGLIRRMTVKLDPRQARVWPIGAPSAEERGNHYLRRFWARLPDPGTLGVFDRSWYGRVLVERVEGFAPPAAWRRAYDEINAFERMLVDDGVRLVKLFLHIDRAEQLKRFRARLEVDYKRWKLTADDIRNHLRREDYVTATDEMFARTSTGAAPWHAIPANNKWYARVTGMQIIADALSAGVELAPPPMDETVAAAIADLEKGRPARAAKRFGW